MVSFLSVRFNGHFPGGLGLASTRMSPFWILVCPTQGALSNDAVWRLFVWCLSRSSGRRAAYAAGWCVLADWAWLRRPGFKLPLHASVAGLGGGISWRTPAYSLLELRMLEVVVTTGTIWRASLQQSFFTGRMPFLSPNQQCQSTEGKSISVFVVWHFFIVCRGIERLHDWQHWST